MATEVWFLGGFVIFIALMLAIDLGIFSKKDKEVSIRQAAIMSGVWIALALLFYFLLTWYGHFLHGIDNMAELKHRNAESLHNLELTGRSFAENLSIYQKNLGLEFITGYLVEYALSVDNIFVMLLIFSAFSVEKKYYHKVLVWGILGAILMRFVFIFLGATLIDRFHWILYIFGAFLIYTGINLFINRNKKAEIDPQKHPVVKLASKVFAVYPHFKGGNFFIRQEGKKYITPLFLVLLIIEFTDIMFAVDSIPAIFSVTHDPYLVFFSNIFAILGLRSMFFLLVNVMDKFRYLRVGLSALLVFIGIKMLADKYLDQIGFTNLHSLLVIAAILAISIVASLAFKPKHKTTTT